MKKMFFALLVLLAAMGSASAQDDAVSRYFEKYMNEERFTVVYISPKMFQMFAKIETDDEDWNKFREVVKDISGLRVLSADSITDGVELYKEALTKVPTGQYSELLTVRDGKENVRIWVKDTDNIIEELLLLVGAPDEFTLLSFTGQIDLDKISTLSKKLDIQGVEQLEKIKSKPKN